MDQENLQRAKDAFAAFLRGDLDSVMRDVADEVEWVIPGPSDLPWAGTFRGKQAVGAWFGTLDQALDIKRFEPYQFVGQGDTVVVLVHGEAIMRHNQRRYSNESAQVLTYREGKLVRYQVFEDTEVVAVAYRGQ